MQLISGKTPLVAALWLLPATGGLVIGSLIAPLITRRVGTVHRNGLVVLVAASLVMGIGSGFVGTVATDVVVGAAPADRSGAASAISETGAELGGALGIAVLGNLGLAVYRTHLDGTLPMALTQLSITRRRARSPMRRRRVRNCPSQRPASCFTRPRQRSQTASTSSPRRRP